MAGESGPSSLLDPGLCASMIPAVEAGLCRPILHHLNADSSWLLQLPRPASHHDTQPPNVSADSHSSQNARVGKSDWFNILIDPWLAGSQIDFFRWFSRQWHATESSCKDIQDVETLIAEVESLTRRTKYGTNDNTMDSSSDDDGAASKDMSHIDLVVISHEFTDHCHRATLAQIDKRVPVLATDVAAGVIDSWHHFETVKRIPHFCQSGAASEKTDSSVDWRKLSSSPIPDWLSVSRLVTPRDMGYLHSAVMITFSCHEAYSPNGDPTSQGTIAEAILYTPHGLSAAALRPVTQARPEIRTLALLHGLFTVSILNVNTINLGAPNGIQVQRLLRPKYWMRTHDEDKKGEGLIGIMLRKKKWTLDDATEALKSDEKVYDGPGPRFLDLKNGEGCVLT